MFFTLAAAPLSFAAVTASNQVVETTAAACLLAERAGVQMPIAFQMREVLYGGRPPREALDELVLRSLKKE